MGSRRAWRDGSGPLVNTIETVIETPPREYILGGVFVDNTFQTSKVSATGKESTNECHPYGMSQRHPSDAA